MKALLASFFYKIRKDITFKVTLFIGLGMAILMTLIYLLFDMIITEGDIFNPDYVSYRSLNGLNLLLSSLSPTANFGLTLPITLISFIVLEFSNGTIRNKIIAGNSKIKIYISIIITSLIYVLSLITIYVLLCFLLGTIFGGFDPNGTLNGSLATLFTSAKVNSEYIVKFIVLHIFIYINISIFTVFVATTFRNIGPSIPVVIIVFVLLSVYSSIISSLSVVEDEAYENLKVIINVTRIIDPLYAINVKDYNFDGDTTLVSLPTFDFVSSIINNAIYSLIFFGFGILEFSKRDIK